MIDHRALMQVADEQIDWIASKLQISREAGRLALLSVLMTVRDRTGAQALLAACKLALGAFERNDAID